MDDDRWIKVGGRRWRRSDPSIPPALRQELVDELMSARRAVAATMHSGDDIGLARARRRVQAAKVALGERGAPWWEATTDAILRRRAEATIAALARHRSPDGTICPSDAARVFGGTSWRHHMDMVRHVAAGMAEQGLVEISQHGNVVAERTWRGPVRIRHRER